MKQYKIRPGVVMVCICGTYMLVSDAKASEFCPFARKLNEMDVFFWSLIKQGLTFEEMIKKTEEEYYIVNQKQLRDQLKAYLEICHLKGYLI